MIVSLIDIYSMENFSSILFFYKRYPVFSLETFVKTLEKAGSFAMFAFKRFS